MRYYTFLFFFFFFFTTAISQKKVGIFYVSLRLEEPLMNDVLMANPSNSVSNRFSKNPLFPQYLLDSLNSLILKFAASITKGKSSYVYKITPGQDTIFTCSGGELEGFPRNSKKNALLSNLDEYLDIRFTMLSKGGKELQMPSGMPSHCKPSLIVSISHFDKNGVLLKKYKYNFTSMQWMSDARKSVFVKAVLDRRKTLLHPEDLYILFRKGLEMTEEKILKNE